MKALIPALVGSVVLATACATQPALQQASCGSARLTLGSVNGGTYSAVSAVVTVAIAPGATVSSTVTLALP